MSKVPKITIYGANWCSDCRRTKKYLGEQRIHYEWRDIELETPESKEAYDFVLTANEKVYGKPKRKIPVVKIVENGTESLLIEPSNVELAKQLGIATEAKCKFYDVVIIGAGPAGLTAALYLARDDYSVLVIESSTIGGQSFITNRLDNYPGFPEGITGEQFAENLRRQVDRFGVEILFPYDVLRIGPCHDPEEGGSFTQCTQKKIVTSDGTEIDCNAVLIATGSKYRELVVPGSQGLTGVNVHYCATCDGAFYKGKDLLVVGGGNSAFEESLYLKKKFANSVTILVRTSEPTATPVLIDKAQDAEGVTILTESEVVELKGENSLDSVVVKHLVSGEVKEYHPDGIFVFIGMQPNTRFVKELIEVDDMNFIVTDSGLQTSILGIFAAGDCRSGATNQAISAAGEGASAAISIREFLKKR
ncbi:MAG: FAD-dependent oxidoreductase [Candidatus Thorarchaeota archaeon]